jgi:pilus assembly protein CpaB
MILIAVIGLCGAFLAFMLSSPPPPPEVVVEKLPTIEILVAARDIPPGSILKPEDLRWQEWPANNPVPGAFEKTSSPNAASEFAGKVVRSSFFIGEPVTDAKLQQWTGMATFLGNGLRAYSVDIDGSGRTTAGGFIMPNDYVDVIWTNPFTSETILKNVLVLAVGNRTTLPEGNETIAGTTITLALLPSQVDIISRAMTNREGGVISFALIPNTDVDKFGGPISGTNPLTIKYLLQD